jgi:hypothetical protein
MFRISLNALYQTQHPYWLSSLVKLLLAILTKRQNRSVINPLQFANHHPRPASQTSSRISCPVQRNQQKTPVGQSSSQASCPVQTTETAYPVDSTPHRVNCPVTMQPLLIEDGAVVLGECTNTQRWIKARRIPRRLFLWACTQTKMAIYVTSQHLRFGGGETDPLVEFRNALAYRLNTRIIGL